LSQYHKNKFDLTGRVAYQKKINLRKNELIELDLQSMHNSIFFVQINNKDGLQVQIEKFVKK